LPTSHYDKCERNNAPRKNVKHTDSPLIIDSREWNQYTANT
jgi:hypothetical protein